MMSQPRSEYSQSAHDQTRRRDQLTRSIRLLRRLDECLRAGDPIPSLPEVLAATGLPHPGVETPSLAIAALLDIASEEREAINRRLRLARALDRVVDEAPAPLPAAAPPPPPSPLAEEAERLARIGPRELDGLPYGAILLDSAGSIVAYNDTESRMARLPVEAVIGRNFFTEVAPCTRVKDFEGRFRTLAAGEGPGLATFDFTFPFPFGAQRVAVLLTRGQSPGTVLMALLRR